MASTVWIRAPQEEAKTGEASALLQMTLGFRLPAVAGD
jgi:hypothetical protein